MNVNLNETDLITIISALRIAEEEYRKHAWKCRELRQNSIAQQFDEQSYKAKALADSLE